VIYKRLFQFFLLLLPTQLSLHLWPTQALIFGIRVDYLSPTLYLTDILLFLLFCFWLKEEKILSQLKLSLGNVFLLLLILTFIVINCLLSPIPIISFYKWIKVLEGFVLAVFVKQNYSTIKTLLVWPLLGGLVFTLLLSILQFSFQSTVGGVFSWFGERNFSRSTPGIAVFYFLDKPWLRVYATFPHPNVLAGYAIVVGLLLQRFASRTQSFIAWAVVLTLLLLTMSHGAIVACFSVLILGILPKAKSIVVARFLCVLIVLLSLLLPLLATSIPTFDNQGTRLRQNLLLSSGDLFSQSPILGIGLGSFIVKQNQISDSNILFSEAPTFRFQPVHNVIVLLLVEIGLLGVLIMFFGLLRLLKTKEYLFVFALVVVLITGLVDHYWLTLQQPYLLASIIIGLMLE